MEQYLLLDGDKHKIPAILTYHPEMTNLPAVIMCHGTASNKDEVGNFYQTLAHKLLEYNIASIRINYVGCGDSTEDEKNLNFLNEVDDTYKAYNYLKTLDCINTHMIGIIGFSQGARVMAELLNHINNFSFAISLSGTCHNGIGVYQDWFDKYYEEAKTNSYAMIKLDWRYDLVLSLEWFNQIRDTKPMDGIINFKGPILTIAGTDDKLVPYKHAEDIIDNSSHPYSRSLIISGANHIFNILDDDKSIINIVMMTIVDWINILITNTVED